MKHFVCLKQVSPTDILSMMEQARAIADRPVDFRHALDGKVIGMFFQKPSTRMRFAFEVGAARAGGSVSIFKTSDLQMSRGESVPDTARVLSGFLDAIVIRGRTHQDVEDFAQFGSIPVINGLTAKYYPVGALGAIYTLWRKFGSLEGRKLAFVGDGNNIAHSLMILASKVGLDISVITPEWYEPAVDVIEVAEGLAEAAGRTVTVTNDLDAVDGADVVFTDVWTSIGMEDEAKERQQAFMPYQVNQRLLDRTGKKPVLMHNMPVRRGEEIAADLPLDPIIYENAKNLMHIATAILIHLLKEE